MAVPIYATDLTDILTDMSGTTGWTALGGGAAGLVAPETDFFVQGSNCISKAGWSTAIKGMIYLAGAGVTVPTTGAVFMWIYYWAPNAMDTSSSGGMRFCCGSSATAYYEYTVAGSDKLPFGGWFLSCVDPNTATADFTVGSPTTTEQSFGATIDVPAGGPSKGQPIGIDAFRYGRGTLTCTNGEVANYATFAGAQAYGDDVTRRWGQMSFRDGSYFMSGFLSLGSAGTLVDFRDSDRAIFIRDHVKVASGFNRIEILNASSNVDWTNIAITSLGTNSPGTFVHTAGTFDAVQCQFISMGTFTLLAATVITNSTFRSCNTITAPGSDLRGTSVFTSTVAADAGAVVWDVATNPDGLLDNMTFSKGTNAHHAIDFGTAVTANITLRGCEFTGFGSTADANDSTVRFLAASGSLTLSLVSCTVNGAAATTGNFSVDDAAGIVVTLSINPVTVTVTTKDVNGAAVGSANVFLKAASGGSGILPVSATVNSITRIDATTAEATHAAVHNMSTGDKVHIKGADQAAYNGVFAITLVGVASPTTMYRYTPLSDPGVNATGTITATFVFLKDTTNAVTGILSMSRVITADQNVTGWARKSSPSDNPKYKNAPISGTVLATTGLSATAVLISDQ